MNLEELPEGIRVKLEEEDERQLWRKAEEKGLKSVAEEAGFIPQKLYSWRSEGSYLPKRFVEEFIEDPGVISLKGNGRSKPSGNVSLSKISDELLTRVEESVSVNSEGVPIYQQTDRGCVKRFVELLEQVGDVPYSVYERDVFEVRYPKYLQEIFGSCAYNPVFAAEVDESGAVEDGVLRVREKSMNVDKFSGELHSREKKLQLAIEREDSKEIERLMAAEAAKIREAFE